MTYLTIKNPGLGPHIKAGHTTFGFVLQDAAGNEFISYMVVRDCYAGSIEKAFSRLSPVRLPPPIPSLAVAGAAPATPPAKARELMDAQHYRVLICDPGRMCRVDGPDEKTSELNSSDILPCLSANDEMVVIDRSHERQDIPQQENTVRTCRVCGCTDNDCRGCFERTGKPCHWVEEDLCSACAAFGIVEQKEGI